MSVGLSINQESLGKFKKKKKKIFQALLQNHGIRIFWAGEIFYVKLSFKRFTSDSNAHSG